MVGQHYAAAVPFDYSDEEWEAAKNEIRRELVRIARNRQLITYSDLTRKLEAIRFQPDSRAFHRILDDLSTAEDEQGRGLLTAVVVQKGEEGLPGKGIFTLARSRGRPGSDVEIWEAELKKVWAQHRIG